MVSLMRGVSGRGPMRARTTIGRDHVLVMFSETLTEGERNLVKANKTAEVQSLREAYQELMEPDAITLVESTLNRKVVGFMSTNHFHPDLAAEVFALEPSQDRRHTIEEAEHREG
jgi:uncharacterized protein YbcI